MASSPSATAPIAPAGARGAIYFARRIGSGFDGRIIFEVGCNDGVLLASVAAHHPHAAFIGIDWKCRALHAAATRVAAAGLPNVALLHGRGQDIVRFFGDGELDEVWIFHPEPCDSPRERRNRLVAEPFLLDVHRVLRAGGELVLKTDHAEYHRWAQESAEHLRRQFDRIASTIDFWNDPAVASLVAGKCFAGQVSGYEQRYLRKRRPIHYLALRRTQAA